MLKNTVKVTFNDNKVKTFRNVKKVDTDINYSMYQLVHKDNGETYLFRKDIQSIYFGKNVKVEVF